MPRSFSNLRHFGSVGPAFPLLLSRVYLLAPERVSSPFGFSTDVSRSIKVLGPLLLLRISILRLDNANKSPNSTRTHNFHCTCSSPRCSGFSSVKSSKSAFGRRLHKTIDPDTNCKYLDEAGKFSDFKVNVESEPWPTSLLLTFAGEGTLAGGVSDHRDYYGRYKKGTSFKAEVNFKNVTLKLSLPGDVPRIANLPTGNAVPHFLAALAAYNFLFAA